MTEINLLVLFGASLILGYYVAIYSIIRYLGCSDKGIVWLPRRRDVLNKKLFKPLYEKVIYSRFTEDEFEYLFIEEAKANPKLFGRIPVSKLNLYDFLDWYEHLNAPKK